MSKQHWKPYFIAPTMSEDLISESAVRAALASDHQQQKVTLVSWSTEDICSKFDGATSTLVNIRVKYRVMGEQDTREVCYVAKVNHVRQKEFEDFYRCIFVQETSFYSQVIPALNNILHEVGEGPLAFPRCIYHGQDEKGKEFIYLENLKEAGYRMEDRAIGVGEPHVSLVLKELARLHAASFLLQAKLSHDLLDEFPFLQIEWTEKFNIGSSWPDFMRATLDLHTKMFEKMGGCEKVIEWIRKVHPQVGHVFEKLIHKTGPFTTIIHGDCWINNMLFRYDKDNKPVEMKFLDIQGCRKGSVALDLQHFLTLNAVDEVRRPQQHLTSLLTTYHSTLTQIMKAGGTAPPFTLEQLHQEYMEKGTYGLLFSIMWIPNMVKTPKDATNILDDSEDSKAAERECVLRMVDSNPLLRSRLHSIIDEWTEYGLIP
ncbi:hypothetical protein Pcinc_034146 [Petrolisthes cinctipes]|uniref:CHK kinase-like domain-containing protein n=1 Tax=Petrolisthes cinctipes TaxID=88211 RepID=A0AAE1EQW9_PETCI|nr:hypothetical protein Pcinc_034146 [Petrolisthes cinctipes]